MMLYTIENDKLRVCISTFGGEITSIYSKVTDCEYLWQGDAATWARQAPALFPICGRLRDGVYTYGGKTYSLPCHGFLPRTDMTMEKASATSLTLSLTDSEQTRAVYPFAFLLRVRFSIEDTSLTVTYEAENTGEDTLIFCFGAHPGFRVPLGDDKAEDYAIYFDKSITEGKQVLFSERSLVLHESASYPLPEHKIPYSHELFDAGSLFFTEVGDSVTLRSDVSGRFVRMDFPGFPVLGFWHSEGTSAPFLCIEPWEGIPSYDDTPDALEDKVLMNRLAPREKHTKAYTITVG